MESIIPAMAFRPVRSGSMAGHLLTWLVGVSPPILLIVILLRGLI
jgi:hypothetical protein